MSTKHLILGLAAAALVGSAIGAGHIFAGDDALQVNAAEAGDPLPSLSYQTGLPTISLTDGTLQFSYIADHVANYEEALGIHFYIFEAGSTQITDGTQPEWTQADVVAEFDFTKTHGFASPTEVKEALNKASYDLNPSVYLGAAGYYYSQSEESIYGAAEVVTFANTFNYAVTQLQNIDLNGTRPCSIAESGQLDTPWLNNFGDPDLLQFDFAFFSVGESYVETPTFDINTTDIAFIWHCEIDDFITMDNVMSAFNKAGISSSDYFGVAGRVAPRDGTENNPYLASKDWVVFSGSHQYYVQHIELAAAGQAYSNSVNGTSSPNLTLDLNTNDGASRWIAADDYADHNVYLLLDLEREVEIDTLSIFWENAYALDYNIYAGNPFVDEENMFGEDFLNYWSYSKKLSYTAENKVDQGINIESVYDLGGTVSRYVLIEMITPGTPWAYSIYELKVDGTPVETESYAYAAIKEMLNNIGCEYFKTEDSVDVKKAQQVNKALTSLYNQLTPEEHAKLMSEPFQESTYEETAIYLIERSAYYGSTASSGVKLIGGDPSSFAPIIATVALLGAAGMATLVLAKSRKRSK